MKKDRGHLGAPSGFLSVCEHLEGSVCCTLLSRRPSVCYWADSGERSRMETGEEREEAVRTRGAVAEEESRTAVERRLPSGHCPFSQHRTRLGRRREEAQRRWA